MSIIKNKMPMLCSIDITKKCNLRCAHCYNSSGSEGCRYLTNKEIESVLYQIRDIKPQTLCFCGGEPLMCPELFEWIDIVSKDICQVNLVTNGLLCDETMAKRLATHGIRNVQVSLDGTFSWQHDSLRGRKGAFDSALSAIRNLKKAGISQVSVSMLPDRLNIRNMDYMEQYVQMCLEAGVDNIRCMPYIPMGRALDDGINLFPNEEDMLHFQRYLQRLKEKYSFRVMIEWDDPVGTVRELCRRLLKGIPPKVICIDNDGELKPDIYSPLSAGNIRDESISGICSRMNSDKGFLAKVREVFDKVHALYDLEECYEIFNR